MRVPSEKTHADRSPNRRETGVENLDKLAQLDRSNVTVPKSAVDAAPADGAPLPSASEIARRSGPRAGVPVSSALALRQAQSGVAALARRMDEIERLVNDGKTVTCVFDLDNTLFDTRARTLYVGRQYDELYGTHYFDGLTAADMGEDGRKTGIAQGWPDDVVESFGKHWDKEWWNPDNLVHDAVMQPIVDILLEARRRGAEIVFLTGRTERYTTDTGVTRGFREATLAQLKRAGLTNVKSEQLLLKPDVDTRTAPFKEAELRRLSGRDAGGDVVDPDAVIGFFLTEGRRDIAHVQGAFTDGSVPAFLLDSTFERAGPACTGVPLLPALM